MTGVEPDVPVAEPNPVRGIRWRRVAVLLLVILIAPASWMARRVASKMEFFHLRSVSIEGTRYLSGEAVLDRLALDTLRSVWDDTGPLSARLRGMPQVAGVEISRRLPGTLVVTIRENLPVALAPSPRGMEAVDIDGVFLPIDVTKADLDLPVANQRDRLVLSLLGDLRAGNPVLYRRLSEISRDGREDITLRLARLGESPAAPPGDTAGANSLWVAEASGARTLLVRAPLGVSVSRLADIFPVESDLIRRRAKVVELDLRYRDQVIARLQ